MYGIKICGKGNVGTTKYVYDNTKFTTRLYFSLQKNFSTETVLVKIHHDILKAFEEQKGVLPTRLDPSAAFDTVDHDILIMVLQNMYGIGGLALEWFNDYLRNRAVQVLIGNSVSEAVGIPFSVPWESCAGPVLYNMYSSTMDMLTQGYLVNLLCYTDDKTLYDTFNLNSQGDEDSKRHNMENCLSGIAEWMTRHYMIHLI